MCMASGMCSLLSKKVCNNGNLVMFGYLLTKWCFLGVCHEEKKSVLISAVIMFAHTAKPSSLYP